MKKQFKKRMEPKPLIEATEVMFLKICDTCKISKLLEIDCTQYTNLGTDSTLGEKLLVKTNSRIIYTMIEKMNPMMGREFLYYMDP